MLPTIQCTLVNPVTDVPALLDGIRPTTGLTNSVLSSQRRPVSTGLGSGAQNQHKLDVVCAVLFYVA
jgi:hypothetical protein